MGEAHTNT
jgi:hypothetical protein